MSCLCVEFVNVHCRGVMVGGCAPGCSNSSQKGFRYFAFPRDPERRKEWLVQCKLDNWTRSSNSKLCEAHFEADQFELNRQDAWRKLKPNAVPTIFSFKSCPKRRNPPTKRCTEIRVPRSENSQAITACEQQENDSDEMQLVESLRIPSGEAELQKQLSDMKDRLALLQQLNERRRRKVKRLRKACGTSDERMRCLQQKMNFLTESQNESLARNSTKGYKWGHEITQKALRLRFACGTAGYQALFDEGYPLPYVKTLTRRVSKIHFEPGILQSVIHVLEMKVAKMTVIERDCVLFLGKMEISEGLQLDRTSGSLVDEIGGRLLVAARVMKTAYLPVAH
ncbi:uncharacterized protein LOC135373252 [Ornithodoros turicata]|uniref:uncharacterized protein LOC135373252 n=1 Tax=Ornithodoros turicata TaxID=34597 RepID=UPI003139B9FD